MPGTTHARAAQTVTLGHHLLAHAWALLRDLERFDQWAVRTSVSPLGRRGAGHVDARPRPGRGGRATRVRAPVRQLDRCRLGPGLRAGVPGGRLDLRDAPLAAGGRPRPVDRPRAGLGRARRGVHDRLEHHAAEAEPRYRGARAREGRAHRRRVRGADVGAARPAARVPPRPPGGQGAGVRRRRHARAGPAGVGRGRRDRAVRRRGDARGRVGGGALRHGPRGGARPRRRAVPGGAPPDRRAAEAARPRGRVRCAISPPRSGSRSGFPTGRRCWTRTPPFARGAARVGRRRRASSIRRTRSGCGSRRARRSRRGTDRMPAGPPRARGERSR